LNFISIELYLMIGTIRSLGGSMVKHKCTSIDCLVILKSACFQGVSETTISALRRRISELNIALGDEVYASAGQASGSRKDDELGLWYVVEGGLRIVAYHPHRTCEVSIALLHPGTMFGSLSTLSEILSATGVEEDWIAPITNEPNALNPYDYRVIAATDSKIEYLSADLVKLLSQESEPVKLALGTDLRSQWQQWSGRFQSKQDDPHNSMQNSAQKLVQPLERQASESQDLESPKKRSIFQALSGQSSSQLSSNSAKSVRIHQDKSIPTHLSNAGNNGANNPKDLLRKSNKVVQ
jgi:CRP-like cAMP-binding protein